MGTFLDCVGKPHIPEYQQEEFQQRMLRLFREGGMMCGERVEMFGKKNSLLYFPEPDEDGFLRFCYNYYENDCWEDAGIHDGSIFSNKVGWQHFCRVMAAAYVLEERSSDTPCFADLRDADIPHWFMLGWLKYLFGEELPLENPSLWDTYVFLKNAGRYDQYGDSWDDILERNIRSIWDRMDMLAVKTVEHGTEEVLRELEAEEAENGSEREEDGSLPLGVCYAGFLAYVKKVPEQLTGTEDEQLQLIMKYLAEPDKDTLIARVQDEHEPGSLRDLPLMEAYFPRQIVVKTLAEIYHRDFWELWEQAKEGWACHFYQRLVEGEQDPVQPIPTDVYLHLTPDKKLFCLLPEEMENLSSETRAWLEELNIRFNETLHAPKPWSDGLSFQRSMVETLSAVRSRNARIWAFRDMFYEFLANWDQPAYQAMWKLFEEMAAKEETESSRLRQYLALLFNRPLREEVFGV